MGAGSEIKDIRLADRFAADSGSRGIDPFGEQGVSISAADCVSTGNDAGGGDSGDGSIMKTVRVAATVDYYLVR